MTHLLLVLCLATGIAGPPTAHARERFVQVVVGDAHTCGLQDDGEVVCWGRNEDGEVTPPPGPFTRIQAHGHYTCGLRAGEAIECWGRSRVARREPLAGEFVAFSVGAAGLLAEDAAGEVFAYRSSRGDPVDLPGAGAAAVGEKFACALDSDGGVTCADLQRSKMTAPTTTFTRIGAGDHHVCGVHAMDGSLACFGGGRQTMRPLPRGRFEAIAVSEALACAVRDDGSLTCWGDDTWGQASPPAGRFEQVDCGDRHGCAIDRKGRIECWGDDRWGQVSRGEEALVQAARDTWKDRVMEAIGHQIGLSAPRFCEGLVENPGWSGEIATTGTVDEDGRPQRPRPRPRHPRGEPAPAEVEAAPAQDAVPAEIARCFDAYASTPPGGEPFELACRWTVNPEHAEAGYDCTASFSDEERTISGTLPLTHRRPPDPMSGGSLGNSCSDVHAWSTPPDGPFDAVAAGHGHSCGRRPDGTLACWGACYEPLSHPVPGRFTVFETSAGGSWGLRDDGALVQWGHYIQGLIVLPGPFQAAAVGSRTLCVVLDDGRLECHGNDGLLTTPPPGSYRAVGLGMTHACALTAGGEVVCWGGNDSGQCDAPEGIFVDLVVGQRFGCASTEEGEVRCWGWIHHSRERRSPPGTLHGLTAGGDVACALRDDGTPVCWGGCGGQQSGPGQTCESACRAPAGVLFEQIGTDGSVTCGLTADGGVRCWGYSTRGGPGPRFHSGGAHDRCYSPPQ